MIDKSKKRKKGSITEEDISSVLHRYSVNTVLALLQEVAQFAVDKIDWNELVKNTDTGISSAREYQMLWRHLAYGGTLTDQIDDDANIMDDDSDLEHEVEAFPAVSREASAEAAACVKVLIAGYPNDSHLPNNSSIEAPLTINIPNTAPSDSSVLASGTNISIPVSVQKLPLSSGGTCGEKRPITGTSGVNFPPRRKRRGWSTEDDMKLTAAVQKYGERNWACIARGEFMNDRKASELSQRWGNLRKKQGNNIKVGTSSQHSETQLAAAHRAMSLALDMPMGDLKATSQISTVGTRPLHQSQKPSAPPPPPPPPDQHLPRPGPLKPAPIIRQSSDSMVKAAAVAAGARIATSADANSLLEAARSQNVVHITTGGGSSVMKPSTTTTSIRSQLPSNVHFIRHGLAKAPISTYTAANKPNISRPGVSQQAAQGPSAKPAVVGPTPVPNVTSRVENAVKSTPSTELATKTAEDATIVSTSSNEKIEVVVQRVRSEQVEKLHTSGSEQSSDPIGQNPDDPVALPSSEVEDKGKKNSDGDLLGTSVDKK